jgi:hypothetical protein
MALYLTFIPGEQLANLSRPVGRRNLSNTADSIERIENGTT